ncbi:MAG: hypothetical protein ACI8ZN_002407 [Bacteroidia bacterium]|jgi:hypothetical protein
MNKKLKVILIVLLIFGVAQFFRINQAPPTSDAKLDYLTVSKANDSISSLIRTSCYDCHSNQSTNPWYAQIAPVSWWLKFHINEGRKHLNFSEWGNYSVKKSTHKLEECVEMLLEDEMPLWSYTILHNDAKLTHEQKKILITWFRGIPIDKRVDALENEADNE